jgi:hypothetical protein
MKKNTPYKEKAKEEDRKYARKKAHKTDMSV